MLLMRRAMPANMPIDFVPPKSFSCSPIKLVLHRFSKKKKKREVERKLEDILFLKKE